ncbi:DUF805 domain-containing protein [Leucobacter musarum]|uniref:DUF805 domain-containing protein n=1 Tax=Leucobacter musarum TaxID=1930747 RepID=UPI0006A77E4E|nr:DUF805 domain-containing protein [Leucobacter musarum]
MTYPPNPENPGAPEEQPVPGSESTPDPAAPQPPAAPQWESPAQQTPPTFEPPQYGAPQYEAPQYGAPQYGAPQQPPPPYAPPAASLYPNQPQPQYASAPAYAAGVTGVPGPGEPFNGAVDPEDLLRPLYGATFGQSVRRFFKNYANFSGRASRSEYWWIALFSFLVSLIPLVLYIIGIVMLASASATSSYYDDDFGSGYGSATAAPAAGVGIGLVIIGAILLLVIGLATLVPGLAISWRRFHDANFAGPFYFLSFIPYLGGLVVLVFMCLPPSPLGRRFDRV